MLRGRLRRNSGNGTGTADIRALVATCAPPAVTRDVLGEMMGAVLAGDGLDRVAEIATLHAGAPVAVVVPSLGPSAPGPPPVQCYVHAKIAGEAASRPSEVVAEVPIASDGRELGAVLLLGDGEPEAEDYLHLAAAAAVSQVAVTEACDEIEQNLRGSFLEELLERDEVDGEDVVRRAARLGCDLSNGCVGLCLDPGERMPGRLTVAITGARPGALAQVLNGRVYALLPGTVDDARAVAGRLLPDIVVALSSRYANPADAGRSLEEAELMLDVRLAGGRASREDVRDDTYRLLLRMLASHPEELHRFYASSVGPLASHDRKRSTDFLGTLEAYVGHNCNMNATAQAIYAHRHTVSYRLERIRELTGLDPLVAEDRERLSLGLKIHRIIHPRSDDGATR